VFDCFYTTMHAYQKGPRSETYRKTVVRLLQKNLLIKEKFCLKKFKGVPCHTQYFTMFSS